MLLYLTQYLSQFESGFNVFNYLTMRAILGALTALGLWIAGVPEALALALIAAVLAFVPFLGPVLGAIPAMLNETVAVCSSASCVP